MPMWSSVANLKESLSKIALDVHDDDDDEELSIYTSPSRDRLENGNSVPNRRISRNFNSPANSSIINGFDSPNNHEIEQYRKEIKRFQESETEMKKLAVNYAALLKEKEDEISRMTEEIGSLKQNLLAANAVVNSPKTVLKGSGDLSPNRRSSTKSRNAGSAQNNGLSNGSPSSYAKELPDVMEEKNRSFAVSPVTHEAEMKRMAMELDKERDKLASLQTQFQEGQKVNGSLQQELRSLKADNDKMLNALKGSRDDLNQKILEVGRLQMELQRRDGEDTDDDISKLKRVIENLEKEKSNMKREKDELEAALKAINSSPAHKAISGAHPSNKHPTSTDEAFPGNEEMQQTLQKLEKDLSQTRREREKALQELNRLKQHLLEKESEESDKMDEDSKIIEELRETNERQRVQIARLDGALKQAIGYQEEIKKSNIDEHKKAKETIDELNRRLSACMSTIDAKNMEVLNLQTALGQYYAEIETKERLAEELSVAKEESARISKQMKEAHQQVEASKGEKDEILGKLSQAERMLIEGKNRVKKLEEDNEKLRRALEQSMTRLNRMSVDSDFLVDRRIVIKLLVTYFQRNHSKEVLDLMVRMLGFSDEDKQRIGVAQQGAGKGVVRGVLGLPGRLVGGILGGGSTEATTAMASDNQSFADLWVDFLLNENEREKRESEIAAGTSHPDQQKGSAGTVSPLPNGAATDTMSNFSRPTPYGNQHPMPFPARGNFSQHEHSDSEFSTVPLTSSESGTKSMRHIRY